MRWKATTKSLKPNSPCWLKTSGTISKKKKVPNGWDFYLSSNRFTIDLGRQLHKQLGGELKITRKLFSQHKRTSKLLYRMTVLLRMPPFLVGDFILRDGQPLKITAIGKKVFAANLENSKVVELYYKDAVRNFEKLDAVSVIVSKVKPHLEIIHPKTFQSIAVLPVTKNSRLIPGEKTKVLIHEEKVWGIA